MADIRAEIDRIDAGLVRLLAERAAYIDRAAVIKAVAGLPARITPAWNRWWPMCAIMHRPTACRLIWLKCSGGG